MSHSSANRFRQLRRPRRRVWAFTLAELLVVMGIIVLFITLAIPAVNALTGTRSIASAENTIGSFLTRAREEAIGLQEIRGVLFTVDPATDRVMATLVRPADRQGPSPRYDSVLLLDTVPDRDHILLPAGIRLQTAFDNFNAATSSTFIPDRYFGFNTAINSTLKVKFGGVVLFGSDGQLVVRNYGFRIVDSAGNGTGMGDLLKVPALAENDPIVPFFSGISPPARSQLALVLYDKKPYDTATSVGGTAQEGNTGLDVNGVGDRNVMDTWLDDNATPLLINRYTGTLIRGE